MIKIKENSIKTMAGFIATSSNQVGNTGKSSEEIIYLNRKLREAFKIVPNPKNAPTPHFAPTQNIKNQNPAPNNFYSIVTNDKQKNSQAIEDLKRTKESLEEKQKENDKRAEAEKQRETTIEKEEQPRIAEEARKQEEAKKEALRIAEENKKKEEERRITQEKLRQEKIRVETEENKIKEEKRQRLEALEIQREKEKQQRAEAERKKQEDIRRAEAEKRQRLEALEIQREKEKQQRAEAERKKQEDIRRAEQQKSKEELRPETLATALFGLSSQLRQKRSSLEKQLSMFPALKMPLTRKKEALEAEIARIKSGELAAAEKNEAEIENQENSEKEKLGNNPTPEIEKAIKEKLWEIEDRRKEAEKKRWSIEDNINKISEEIKKIDTEIANKTGEEELIRQKIRTANGQEKLIAFALEKGKMEQEMLISVNEKDAILPILEVASGKKNTVATKLKESTDSEKTLSEDLSLIEQKEKQSNNPDEKRKIEQERWTLSEKLKSVVKTKWETEEKLKESETETQELERKIEIINKKIAGIQNIISDKELSLEKEGLPVGKIRDAIAAMFAENGLNINLELLGDIIQPDDITAQSKNSDKNTQIPNHKDINTPPVQANPIIATPPAIKTADIPQATANRTPADDTSTPQKAEPSQPIEKVISQEKKAPVVAQTVPPTKAEGKRETADEAQKVVSKEPVATPKIKDNIPEPESKKEKIVDANKTVPEAIQPAAKKTEPGSRPAAWGPETKLNDIIKSGNPVTATGPATPITPEISPSGVVSGYRERIDIQPAKNIRTFSPENRMNINESSALDQKTDNEIKKPNDNLIGKSPEKLETDIPTPNVVSDRWGQIKKTTTPNVTKPGDTNINNSENQQQPEQTYIAEKPEKNKTLVRILVVVVLIIIVGTAVALMLLKNNPKPDKETNKVTTNTVAKGDTATEDQNNGSENSTNNKKTGLAVLSTFTVYVEDVASIPNLIFPYLKKTYDSDGYYRILIQNKKDNTTVGLRQFMNVFKITAPSGFYSSVSNDFTLFVYSNNGKNRLGFVIPTDNPNSLATAMSGWESSMAQNTDDWFKFIGRKTQSSTSTLSFSSNTTADDIQYRYLSFIPANDNFSIAYAIYNKKFLVLTTSIDSLTKSFSQLPN